MTISCCVAPSVKVCPLLKKTWWETTPHTQQLIYREGLMKVYRVRVQAYKLTKWKKKRQSIGIMKELSIMLRVQRCLCNGVGQTRYWEDKGSANAWPKNTSYDGQPSSSNRTARSWHFNHSSFRSS